jgi:hypothetical protein
MKPVEAMNRLNDIAASFMVTIKHNDPNFTCQGSFTFVNSKPVEWVFELTADEREASQADRPVRAALDGVALLCTIQNGGMTITFHYEFDAEGHLRLTEQLRGTDHQNNLWIFD